ncbi:MAG: ParB/Srx family N-terminal domain-containing protein [Actinomycetales bacterium]|nr:ParB/Srx family N-terminal domain-containing protein [Actinomycetales bacterium]
MTRLVPYERNARTHSPEQVAQIAASIREFGFTNPILVDSSDGIIAGHGRLAAAKVIGMTMVPVIVLDHLTAEQRRAYVIADNKLALNAGWDVDLLSQEIQGLSEVDFDISLLGFSDAEIEGLAADGWASDIEVIDKHDENLDGIQGKIVVKLDGTYRDEVVEAIRMYCDGHAISVEIG